MPGARTWPAALAGLLTGVAGLGLVLGGIGLVEDHAVGGETREWCEGTEGYDSHHGPVERCVRERDDPKLVASDEHHIELYRAGSDGARYEFHPWPVRGHDVEVDFGADGVTVSDEHGVRAYYPNSVYEDTR